MKLVREGVVPGKPRSPVGTELVMPPGTGSFTSAFHPLGALLSLSGSPFLLFVSLYFLETVALADGSCRKPSVTGGWGCHGAPSARHRQSAGSWGGRAGPWPCAVRTLTRQ